ncbi:MAG TPA: siroheme synthase CysG [Gammaproteobacteria bacterium]|nr:siroheme synthase CysG [Gammaproteobacteria bacterium]
MHAASLLPLFVDLRGKPCLVVGGGAVAARKVDALLTVGAEIDVVAPTLSAPLAALAAAERLRHHAREFTDTDVDGRVLVIAATDMRAINARVAAAANAAGRLVNVVDDPELSGAIFPSIARRGELTVAVSSGGAAPVLARLVRARIETLLSHSLGDLAALAGRWRARVQRRVSSSGARRRLWERVFEPRSPVLRALEAGDLQAAERAMAAVLAGAGDGARHAGSVALVGAGPGDPSLLTLRAVRALQEADVILHDRLVHPDVLDLARRDARREDVGKLAGGDHAAAQDAINARLVELARQGLRVVRLKGGDPFIFGRGAEELEALRAHDIAFEIVPGITAALGCAAYAGVPLTKRAVAQQVTLVTAHCAKSIDRLAWPLLAQARHTVVFYMGVGQAALIEARLREFGRAPATPVAIVERGTTAAQRVTHTTLAALAATVAREQVQAPALIIVGEIAAAADCHPWFAPAAASTRGDLSAAA